MRTLVALAAMVLGGVALAGSTGTERPPEGPPPRGGGWREGGRIDHSRRPDRSGGSTRSGDGSWTWGSWGGLGSGWSAGYGPGWHPSGGIFVYRGRPLINPYMYSVGPGVYWSGSCPMVYTDSMVFQDAQSVQAFGYGPQAVVEPRVPLAPGPQGAAAPPAPGGGKEAPAGLIDRGDDLFGRGEFDRAVEAYREAIRKAPDDPLAALALGHGLFATGSYREAAAELRRGLRLNPDLVQVQMNRRAFYGDGRVFDEQLQRLEHWVKTSPDDAAARFLLGYNYFFTQHPGKAAVQFALLGRGDAEAQLFLREIRKLE